MAPAECGQRRRERLIVRVARRQRDQHLPLGVGRHVVRVEHATSLGRAPLAEGEQAAEAAVGGAVTRIAEEREPAGKVEPRAGEEPQARSLRCHSLGCDVGTHRAGQRVAVGDADGGEPEFRSPLHQLVGVGGAAQEAEVAHRL